eukprot:GCRY01003975.1.p1 GENE.GCRY01003975.1~~GCRY01003975.1.p1  ORF type:complete len:392 (+),score=63.57 GCRY01003975.1:101-1276(+)
MVEDNGKAGIFPMLIVINMSFSVFHILSSLAMEDLSPIIFTFFRMLLAATTLNILVLIYEKDYSISSRRDFFILILLGFLTITLNLTFIVGLYFSNAMIAGTLTLLSAPLTFFVSVCFKKEKFSFLKMFGSIISVIGGVLVVVFGTEDADDPGNVYLGGFFVFMNALSFSFYILIQADIIKRISTLKLQAYSFGFGMGFLTLIVAIAVFFAGWEQVSYMQRATLFEWGVIVYAGTITCTNFFGIAYATKFVLPSITASFTPIQPLTSVLILAVIWQEYPSPLQVLGGIVTIGGLWMVLYGRYQENKQAAQGTEKEQQLEVIAPGGGDKPPAQDPGTPRSGQVSPVRSQLTKIDGENENIHKRECAENSEVSSGTADIFASKSADVLEVVED